MTDIPAFLPLNLFLLTAVVLSVIPGQGSRIDPMMDTVVAPEAAAMEPDAEAFLIRLVPLLNGMGFEPDPLNSEWPETIDPSEFWLAGAIPGIIGDSGSIHMLRIRMPESPGGGYHPDAVLEVWVFEDTLGPVRAVSLLDSLDGETWVFKNPHFHLVEGNWMVRVHTRAEMFRPYLDGIADLVRTSLDRL